MGRNTIHEKIVHYLADEVVTILEIRGCSSYRLFLFMTRYNNITVPIHKNPCYYKWGVNSFGFESAILLLFILVTLEASCLCIFSLPNVF